MCGQEVLQKQKAAPPQPTFISVEALGGHELDLFSTCVGVEGLTLSSLTLAPGGSAFAGVTGRKWCDGCPHKNGTCICDPYNNKSPPPSVYLDTRRYNGYTWLRVRLTAPQGNATVHAAVAAETERRRHQEVQGNQGSA
eukprot:3984901-Prymnesium_polylepis.1